MSEPSGSEKFDLEYAESAYTVISRYVDHVQVSGMLIGLLAARLGEENLGFLLENQTWKDYMNSKRDLEASREDIEGLTKLIAKLRGENV